jgi:hypothetical protein
MTWDSQYTYIRGNPYPHATVRRDWVCSTCGSNLATRWYEDAPHWRTVCARDDSHSPDGFVHKTTWQYLQHRDLMEAAQTQDVFAHLPPEMQAAILATK